MDHSADSQQYISAYDPNPPRSRQPSGLLGSIWAPQPQPSETTWPRTLDSFSRVAEKEAEQSDRPDICNHGLQPFISREDIFGPPQPSQMISKEIGAIGDGRKKNSPEFSDKHVEQLLRTLNLNSPAPFGHNRPSPLAVNVENSSSSPDFSPASVSSALLTPTDLSPTGRSFDSVKLHSPYEASHAVHQFVSHPAFIFESNSPGKSQERLTPNFPSSRQPLVHLNHARQVPHSTMPFFEPFTEAATPGPTIQNHAQVSSPADVANSYYSSPPARRVDHMRLPAMDWRLNQGHQPPPPPDWRHASDKAVPDFKPNVTQNQEEPLRSSFPYQQSTTSQSFQNSHEPINFLSLLHPSSSPPYHVFVARIIKSSDQQASIFLQQKLKVADLEEREKIVDAICARGFEMMAHRFGNWAVQRCLEAASTARERKKIVACMRGRIVDLAVNCYGCHVLQKALDCEEDIRLVIVSELLLGDPAQTLVNKHASHVWSKIMELSWTPPAPPIFAYVNKSLKGKWASLACHETGSLVVQHAFENLEADAKDGIVDELLNHGFAIFSEVTKSQWGSYCIQHILEHGSEKHRRMTLDHLLDGLLEFATNEQGAKSVTKALKEGGIETLDKVVRRMCEPAKGARRAMIVDLALSVTGSQLIASVLPTADKDQRALLYECIRGHIVTLRGCKTGSKVIWLL
ncbi:hypothetical protein CVT25_002047 [Psilocybe cyanescens]|uniref:PUM-HD domain-containing protein n=1 Tax=Psilocybe cyanescens TaxID=93625 RepID=A0A409VTB7_PSICY|nr:hypothetical protein CVT25_002047 [Psilocybe cyanescens]